MDDLNYLFHRQQQERARADRAPCGQARAAHEHMAEFYEQRIRHLTSGRIDMVSTLSRSSPTL
jgi:hypothetical protein